MSPSRKLLIGIVGGAALGLVANLAFADQPGLTFVVLNFAQPAGDIFVNLLLLLGIPLLFSAVVMGVCDLDLKHLGRLGARTLVYTVAVSAIAVAIGIALVTLFQPGHGLDP